MELQYEEVFNAAQKLRPQNQMEENSLNKKRKRTSYSSAQIVELERVFDMDNYLSIAGRVQLVKEMGLTENQVIIWFQNCRSKVKKGNRDSPDSGNIVKKARRPHNMLDLVESEISYESLHGQQSWMPQKQFYGCGTQQQPFLRPCDVAPQQLEVAKQMPYLTSSKATVPLISTDKVYHHFSVAAHYSSSIEGNHVNGPNYSCQVNVLEIEQQLLPQPGQQQHQQPQSTHQHLQPEKRSLLDAFFDSFLCTVYDDPLEDFIVELPSGEIINQNDFYKEMCNFFKVMNSPSA
ncbi:homeobox protein Hox-D3a-like [Copidosoma floridanum]|uniref:homeobox protein Hox-D3a-like n=1 Tax=Copidosoma floridanum TaxID=29053 RepID=UPI0006C9D7DA|nr:homeobox protein Hox-D3a-like [Copidosoma floridanum]